MATLIPLDLTFSLRRAQAIASMVEAKFEMRVDVHQSNGGLWAVRLATTDIPLRLQNQIDTFVSAVSALLNGDSHA